MVPEKSFFTPLLIFTKDDSVKSLHPTIARYWFMTLAGLILLLLSIIPVRLSIAFYHAPQPQAILILGGNPKREAAAAQLAHYYPKLDVWVSSGASPKDARSIFQAAGVSFDRVHLDYRATDTVTNFTTLVPEFKQHGIRHLYLVTSNFHMPRARAIATIILGSQGIAFTTVSVPSSEPEESTWRIVRDCGRSILWIITGRTGGRIGLMLQDKLPHLTAHQK
jgi:uncharacterized SAM-binding protein YcdF (DUF218 family)